MSQKKTVMIVDDRLHMTTTLADILDDHGYTVVTAEDGFQALERVKEFPIDLALIDIVMPGINGVETFKKIKKLSPQTTAIMMTAFTMEELAREAIREGAYGLIYKPFDLNKILGLFEDCFSGPLILIADDQSAARETFMDVLTERGYKTTTVESGYEAIEKVKEQHYEVIFLDLAMPFLDGEKTLMEIKKINPNASVVMYSGYEVEETLKRCLENGAYAWLYKPYDPEKVIGMIEQIMSQKETDRVK